MYKPFYIHLSFFSAKEIGYEQDEKIYVKSIKNFQGQIDRLRSSTDYNFMGVWEL